MMLGNVGLATGDFAAAEQNLRRAVQAGADPAAAQIPLVQSLLAQRKILVSGIKLFDVDPGFAQRKRLATLLERCDLLRHKTEVIIGRFAAADRSADQELRPRSAASCMATSMIMSSWPPTSPISPQRRRISWAGTL